MPIRSFLFFLLLFAPILSISQDKQYTLKIIDTLSSPSFFGRGYVNLGDSLASEFIRQEYESIGLQSVKGSYFQTYLHSVNTFPGTARLLSGDKDLNIGSQYLVDPSSRAGKGNFRVDSITVDDLSTGDWIDKLKKSKRKAISVDLSTINQHEKKSVEKYMDFIQYLKFEEDIPAKAILVYHQGKQPWYISDKETYRPVFLVFKDSIASIPDEITFEIDNKVIENYRSRNVIGMIPGESDSSIVITAHYDHLGMMGSDCYFPGANDNASGVALMLDLARHFKDQPLKYTLYIVAFSGEEAGLKGSRYFVQNPTFPLGKIKFLLNLDLAGTGIDGATVVNGKIFEEEFDLLKSINDEKGYLKTINARSEACNSDHCFFYNAGIKCFYIYTLGGTIYYHDIFDKAKTLPLNEYGNYFSLLRDFLKRI